jgi:hypothetical protein
MNNKEWLESLKVGDEVAVEAWNGWHSIEKVTKITKTQIVTNLGRYKRGSGLTVGGSIWHSSEIVPVTDQIRKRVRKSIIISKLRQLDFTRMTLDQLERIQAIIKNEQ